MEAATARIEDPCLEELHKNAQNDLATIKRVSHKLALTEAGAPLMKVLNLLLPRLLQRIGSNHSRTQDLSRRYPNVHNNVVTVNNNDPHSLERKTKALYDAIHAKTVELLSHIIKRVRADSSCQLPCQAIIRLLYNSETRSKTEDVPIVLETVLVNPFTLNLSLTFLTIGIPRTPLSELETLLPSLVALLGVHTSNSTRDTSALSNGSTKNQSFQIAHLLLRALESIVGGSRSMTSSTSSSSSSFRSGVTSKGPSSAPGQTKNQSSGGGEAIQQTRDLCQRYPDTIGAALYDLLLDVLLYQPTRTTTASAFSNSTSTNNTTSTISSDIPPPGLSTWGKDRLISGASVVANSWVAEYATKGRLRDLKLRVLDFVAPCRRWDVFGAASRIHHHIHHPNNENNNVDVDGGSERHHHQEWVGTTRAVALMITGSGDLQKDVADCADSYLKAHLDSRRTISHTERSENSVLSDGNKRIIDTGLLLGNPISLSCALLSLVVGDITASRTISNNKRKRVNIDYDLGLGTIVSSTPSNSKHNPIVMTTKRRMVSQKTATFIMNFCSTNILNDLPGIFSNATSTEEEFVLVGSTVGKLILVVVNKYLGPVLSSSGSSLLNSTSNPSVAASKLLNSASIRLVTLYNSASSLADDKDTSDEEGIHTVMVDLHKLLAANFSVACSIVAVASTRHTGDVNNQVGIETRDASYGTISTIARSEMNIAGMEIFNCGEEIPTSNVSSTLPSGTAKMLFGCVGNESETLKPRAVAALDSLLSCYCRLLESKDSEETKVPSPKFNAIGSNPWMSSDSLPAIERSKVLNSSKINFDGTSKSLLPLLWGAARTSQPKASRHASAQWTNELLRKLDLKSACHLLCFLAGDDDATTSAVAKEGLQIGKQMGEDEIQSTIDGEEVTVPEFHEVISVMFSKPKNSKNISSWKPSFFEFSPRGKGAALRYIMICLLCDLYGGEEEAVSKFLTVLSETLLEFMPSNKNAAKRQGKDSIDLLDEASISLAACLRISHFARGHFVNASLPLQHQEIAELALRATSSKARRHLAASYGFLFEDLSIWSSGHEHNSENLQDISCIIDSLQNCSSKLLEMQSDLFMVGEAHGAAFLGSRCVRAYRLLMRDSFGGMNAESGVIGWNFASKLISSLGQGTLHSDEIIGNACADGLSVALSFDGYDVPILCNFLCEGVAEALNHLSTALKRYGHGDQADPNRIASLSKATGIVLAASTVRTASDGRVKERFEEKQDPSGIGAARLCCVNALFALLGSTTSRKDPEVSLVVGEALAEYADAYSPKGATWSKPSVDAPKDYDSTYAEELPPHSQVIYTLFQRESKASSPHKRTACAPVLLALIGRAARMAIVNAETLERSFGKEVLTHLIEFQNAFLQLLSDPKSKQLSRESCCLGLAACQGLSDAAQSRGIEGAIENKEQSILLNNRLLKAFGQTTNHGSSAMMETRSQNEQRMRENSNQEAVSASPMTEAFGIEAGETGGAAGVGEAALGAFKEMAAAAHVLGRPDVLYSLMLLSVTHVTWSTAGFRDRYNSSSLLGTGSETSARNQKEIREALKPHMSKLIPRLLRACNDPGKQTREQINALWIGLTGGGADARDLISHHFTQTIDTLLDDATNKLWRARVGACGALADVIVGRSWEDLGGGGLILEDDINSIKDTAASRLLRLYRVSVRSLDDVRLTVRESGEALARSVRSLTVRLCDPNISMEILKGYGTLSTKKRMKLEKSIRMTSTAAAGTVLPWLMKYGLNQPCAEATGFAVSCLLGIVEISKSETLTPVLPELIGHLLLAMSGLEPAALNYFQNRAAGQQSDTSGYDQLERVRLQLAQSGPIASALNKCLEMMKHAPLVSQRKLIPELDSSLRRGAGFATRAATADAVSALCSVCPLAFKFTGNSTSNPTVRLLRALYYASERERGIGARDKMTHAFGNLAALAPGSSVRSIAMRLCERYKHAMGSNDDPATRKSAVSALRAIAVRASNQFADGGSKNVWERVVLPLSFIGQRDDKIGPIWKEIWEEGGQVAALSLTNESMRNCQLQETLLPDLVISLIEALDDVSWQRRVMACSTISELSDTKILSPPAKATGRKVSLTDTSSILRAKHRADASQKLLCACIQLIDKSKRVWNGKGDLIKTIANISSNWASYTYMEESNSSHIYGWKKEDIEKCSWVPILHVPNSWEHLHPNDNWFQIKKQTDTSMQEDLDSLQLGDENQDTDVNNDSENNTLSFEECDRILEDESDHKMLSEPDQNKSNIPQPVTYSGLCRLIFEQSVPFEGKSVKSFFSTEVLPYRTAALQSLAMLLKSANQGSCSQSGTSTAHTKFLFKKIVPPILSIVDVKGDFISKEQKEQFKAISVPPVIVARCFDCVSAVMWGNMDSTCTDLTDFTKLFLHNCGGNQAAWTVKESAALAAANLSSNANLRHLRKIHVTENLLECCIACLKDRKFSKVRIAGLKILLAMSKRPRLSRDGLKGTDENDDALILDALLPYKERMLEISKLALRDSESKVTAIASDICSTLSCWP